MIEPLEYIKSINRYAGVQPVKKANNESLEPSKIIKIDGNENPYGLPADIRLSEDDYNTIQLYPDPLSSDIVEAIAEKENLSIENIFVSAGSDELLDLLIRGYVNKNETVLTISPTFGMYQYLAEVNGVNFKSMPMELKISNESVKTEYVLNKEAFFQEASKCKIAFIARPNNPDGQVIDSAFIKKLLSLPILVAIDEAYIEFSSKESLVNEVKAYDNLVILRTFSKSYALGGVRIGYGILPASVKRTFLSIKQPYNVNGIAQILAYKAYNSSKIFENTQKIIQTRNNFLSDLLSIAEKQQLFKVHASEASYVLLTFLEYTTAKNFYLYMKKRGIYIRFYDKKDKFTNVRISIGLDKQMEEVIRQISLFIYEGPKI